MISGAHMILYSKEPEKDREFLASVLKLPNVDVGRGWLIFGLPPSEIAVHPSGKNNVHEIYFMCEDIETLIKVLKKKKIQCGPVVDQGWGLVSGLKLPGGGKISVYQPRHPRPPVAKVSEKKKILKRSVTKKK